MSRHGGQRLTSCACSASARRASRRALARPGPFKSASGWIAPTGGGRVTELTARPLLAAFYPDLAAIRQPLAGEFAARRDLLERMAFCTGYGVEIGLLLDVYAHRGIDAIAQVDLDVRQTAISRCRISRRWPAPCSPPSHAGCTAGVASPTTASTATMFPSARRSPGCAHFTARRSPQSTPALRSGCAPEAAASDGHTGA